MNQETRRRLLLERIGRDGFASLTGVAASLGASESTVRRDLEALDHAGLIKRVYGGAVSVAEMKQLPALEDRAATSAAEKRAIGRLVASLIEDGESILLDGGTTTLEVARALVGRPVQIVTNSLPIATLIAASKETDLILIGGYVYPKTGVALGPIAIDGMKDVRVRKTIMGAGGIIADGIYNHNLLLVETQRRMTACAQEVFVVADHTKFGKPALAWLCGLESVRTIVVDAGLSEEHRGMLRDKNVNVLFAEVEPDPFAESFNGQPRDEATRSRS